MNEYDEEIIGVANSIRRLASAITPADAMPATDRNGIKIGCLTEAVIGVAAALHEIADAIRERE